MSTTIPEITPENKRKTLADIAQDANKAPKQNKQQPHHGSRGAAMNAQFEAAYFTFVGNAVEVKTADGEVVTGLLAAATPYGHIIVKTGNHEIIIKTWQQMKRAMGSQKL
jgi:hypothetical protein